MITRQKKVLIFEDFDSISNVLINALQKRDLEIKVAKTLNQAREELNGVSLDLVIVDLDLKDKVAQQLVMKLRELSAYLYTPIVALLTGNKDQYTEELEEYKIACYLSKPFDIIHFNSVLDRLIGIRQIQ